MIAIAIALLLGVAVPDARPASADSEPVSNPAPKPDDLKPAPNPEPARPPASAGEATPKAAGTAAPPAPKVIRPAPPPRPDPCSVPGREVRPGCEGRAPGGLAVLPLATLPGQEGARPASSEERAKAVANETAEQVAELEAVMDGLASEKTPSNHSAGERDCAADMTCAPPKTAFPGAALPGVLLGALALLLLAAGAAFVFLRRKTSEGGFIPSIASDPPTALRRDLVLVDEKGGQHRLPGLRLNPSASIGSSQAAGLLLSTRGVADIHVHLWVRDGRLWVRPAEAETVVLNDRLLTTKDTAIVSTGDRIRLGVAEYGIMID